MEKELIIWNTAYSVGVEVLDNQHKELVRLINKLYNLYIEKETDKISEVIEAIRDYTNYHFSTEEKLFREKGYPKAEEHTKIHNDFIKDINELADKYKNNPAILSIKTMTLLQRWLINHIMEEDKEYAPYLV